MSARRKHAGGRGRSGVAAATILDCIDYAPLCNVCLSLSHTRSLSFCPSLPPSHTHTHSLPPPLPLFCHLLHSATIILGFFLSFFSPLAADYCHAVVRRLPASLSAPVFLRGEEGKKVLKKQELVAPAPPPPTHTPLLHPSRP